MATNHVGYGFCIRFILGVEGRAFNVWEHPPAVTCIAGTRPEKDIKRSDHITKKIAPSSMFNCPLSPFILLPGRMLPQPDYHQNCAASVNGMETIPQSQQPLLLLPECCSCKSVEASAYLLTSDGGAVRCFTAIAEELKVQCSDWTSGG